MYTQEPCCEQSETPSVEGRELRERAARSIAKHRLSTLFVFLLESHRPLRNVGYQASIIAEPLLYLFPGIPWRAWRSALFENDEHYAEFLHLIEKYSNTEKYSDTEKYSNIEKNSDKESV